jgi:hypothetical protein
MHALAVCQAERLLGEVALGVDDHVIGAGLLRRGHLLVRRHPSDDVATPQLDDLGQQQTESARRRVNEGDVAGLHRIEVGREVASGESLHHHRGRRAVVDRVGNRDERGGRDSDPLRIPSGCIDPGYALAGCDVLDAAAHRHDPADAFDAEDLGVVRAADPQISGRLLTRETREEFRILRLALSRPGVLRARRACPASRDLRRASRLRASKGADVPESGTANISGSACVMSSQIAKLAKPAPVLAVASIAAADTSLARCPKQIHVEIKKYLIRWSFETA